jgi:hypothetical protein
MAVSDNPAAEGRTGAPLQLEAIQQVLEQTIAAAAAREQRLASVADDGRADPGEAWRLLLEPLEAHLRAFQAASDSAHHGAAEVDAALAASEEALRRWFGAAGANRQRLADGAGREV